VQLFEDLASELDSAWLQYGRDEVAWPELAQTMLDRFAPASAIAPIEVFRWLIDTDQLPRQFDPHSHFGNLALTVATRDDFHIDVLVWTDATTTIHQHCFSGAFHVLCGSSLHTLWSFQETRQWSDRLKGGQLAVRSTEWLRNGSTRAILPGTAMIHSLFHLDSPSITVVVRTPSATKVSPQLTYQRSGLALDPFFDLGPAEKVRQLLTVLWESDHSECIPLSEIALRNVSLDAAARIVSSIGSQGSAEVAASLVGMLAKRDPELATLLGATFARKRCDRVLVGLRRQTRSPRHRMLLALVLNLPNRSSIDLALAQIAPGEVPEDWLWSTIRSMHDTLDRGFNRNLLGFALNEVSEQTIKLLLRGHPAEDVSRAVAEHDELVDDARALCAALSASPILSPLLESRLALEQHA
jgi:hypothetical protein